MRQDQVDQRLEDMEIIEKLNYAGEKLIGNYGCYSCHNIAGFEDKKPIGTSLNVEGSKLISKLDFAFWHDEIPHTKWDWFYNKIDKPETFDLIPNDEDNYAVKQLPPLDKSRMPHYGLTDKEIDALVTLIMGLVKDEIPESKLPEKTPAYLAVSEGERFIHTNNCLGCHKIDGEGGAIWTATEAWLEEVAGTDNSSSVVFGYQWNLNGSAASDGDVTDTNTGVARTTTVAGATTPTLTLTSTQVGVQTVSCTVSSADVCNSPVTSNNAELTVVSAADTSRSVLNYEIVREDNTTLYDSGDQNLVDSSLTFSSSTSNPSRVITVYSTEKDLPVKITLSGGAGIEYLSLIHI